MLLTFIQAIYHAVEDLLAEYKQMMLNLAYSILRDYQRAEDAVQEAAINLSKNMEKMGGIKTNETKNYVYTVTKNASVSMYRKENKDIFANGSLAKVNSSLSE